MTTTVSTTDRQCPCRKATLEFHENDGQQTNSGPPRDFYRCPACDAQFYDNEVNLVEIPVVARGR